MVQPARKGLSLANRLVAIKRDRKNANQFELKRLRKEVEKLMPHDPYFSHLALAFIEDLEGNYQRMMPHINTALKMNPKDPVGLTNCANSLIVYSQYFEAAEYFIKSYKLAGPDKDLLESLIDCLFHSGRFIESLEYAELLDKIDPDNKQEIKAYRSAILTMAKLKISEEDIITQERIFEEFIASKNIFPKGNRVELVTGEYFTVSHFFNLPVKEIETLQDEFDDVVWKKGLTAKLKDYATIEFYPTPSDKIIDDFENMEPQVAEPIDRKQMERIAELIKGVEL